MEEQTATMLADRSVAEPLVGPARGFEVLITSNQPVDAFCRVLATVVNGGPMHLARVIVAGTIAYPVAAEDVLGPATVRVCRFELRNGKGFLDEGVAQDTLSRIGRRYPWSDLTILYRG